MAVTIRQVAAAAGVSRGTVDRVLHNRPGVNPAVAAHVRKVADEMGFLPNRAGRILAARKQPVTVGCFLPSVGNPFYEEIKRGIRAAGEELRDFGVTVLLQEVEGYDAARHVKGIRDLLERRCNALCVSTVDTPPVRGLVDEIAGKGIPVLALNTDLTDTARLCYVGNDYYKAGSTAAGLLALMLRESCNLLIVTGSLQIKGHNERIRGFSRTLRAKGVRYRLVDIFESLDNDAHAYEMVKAALEAHPETDCIYIVAAGWSGVCRAVTELGLKGKLRIVCHDDVEETRQLIRDGVISCTVCQGPYEQGYRAIQMMYDYFLGGKSAPPQSYLTGPVVKIPENLD